MEFAPGFIHLRAFLFKWTRQFFLLGLFFTGASSEARVFNFSHNWVAAYFRGTGGFSLIGEDLYRETSGRQTAFEDNVAYNFTGEIGFAFLFGDRLTARVGFEGLQTKAIFAEGLKESTGAKYMDVDSKAVVFNPNLTLEYAFISTATSRFFAFAGVGYSFVKVTNDYALTSTATTDYGYSSGSSYKETWAGNAISYQLGGGVELFVFDNVTFSLDAGWRQVNVDEFTYEESVTGIRGSSMTSLTKGQRVNDNDDQKIALNLGGGFVGVIFKFYIPPLN